MTHFEAGKRAGSNHIPGCVINNPNARGTEAYKEWDEGYWHIANIKIAMRNH